MFLFVGSSPFADAPLSYILAGLVYSLLVIVMSVGWVLAGKRRLWISLFLVGGIVLPVCLSFFALVAARVPSWVFGVYLYTAECVLGLVVVALAIISISGWLSFRRGAIKGREAIKGDGKR